MTKALAVVLGLLSGASLATPIDDACKALEKKAVADAFPGAREVLCKGVPVDCKALDEKKCDANIACIARRGSGSGPGCTKCTPDIVYWDCQRAPKENVAAQVLRFDGCAAKGGEWRTRTSVAFGECVVPTGTVNGRVVNAGADVMLRVEGMELPGLLQGGAFSLELDAHEPTKFEITDRKTGQVVTKTVIVKPRERVAVEFTFPK